MQGAIEMGSRYHPKFYDEKTLAAMDQALNDVWRTVAFRTPASDDELRDGIARLLERLVDEGITEAAELRQRALIELLPRS
jgi:hypothetical protein